MLECRLVTLQGCTTLGKEYRSSSGSVLNIPAFSVTLTPSGNFLVAGSNPNDDTNLTVKFSSEFRVELLNPPFMSVARPVIESVPTNIDFGETFTIPISIPSNLKATTVQGKRLQKERVLVIDRPCSAVALMDLGFSSHAFHSSARLVFLDFTLSNDQKSLTLTAPPNRNIYPPGPAYIFLTIDDVTSTGQRVMVGSGASPPQAPAL